MFYYTASRWTSTMSMFLFSDSCSLLFWSMYCPNIRSKPSASSLSSFLWVEVPVTLHWFPKEGGKVSYILNPSGLPRHTICNPGHRLLNLSRALAPSYCGCRGHGPPTRSLSSSFLTESSFLLPGWSDRICMTTMVKKKPQVLVYLLLFIEHYSDRNIFYT